MNILCVGGEPGLIQSRIELLKANGYQAQYATVEEAYEQLRTDRWDLVIMSERLAIEHPDLLGSDAQNLRVLRIDVFLMPSELLKAVAQKLGIAQAN
jgi:DNA-binding response OmpR family regulator